MQAQTNQHFFLKCLFILYLHFLLVQVRVPAIALDLSGKRVKGGGKLDHLVRNLTNKQKCDSQLWLKQKCDSQLWLKQICD